MKKDNIKVIKFIIFLCLLQGASYYICKFTPFDTIRLMSSFDDKIVRDPNYVFFYISWFPMLVIVPFLVSKTNKDNLFKYAGMYIIGIIVSFLTFFFFPTEILREELVVNNISSWILNIVYMFDTPATNCLPSMHVFACLLFIYFSFKIDNKNKVLEKVIRIGIIFLSIMIIVSTMVIKQHVIYDVVGASILFLITLTGEKLFKLSNKVEELFKKL